LYGRVSVVALNGSSLSTVTFQRVGKGVDAAKGTNIRNMIVGAGVATGGNVESESVCTSAVGKSVGADRNASGDGDIVGTTVGSSDGASVGSAVGS